MNLSLTFTYVNQITHTRMSTLATIGQNLAELDDALTQLNIKVQAELVAIETFAPPITALSGEFERTSAVELDKAIQQYSDMLDKCAEAVARVHDIIQGAMAQNSSVGE